jgi:hypothetical protein
MRLQREDVVLAEIAVLVYLLASLSACSDAKAPRTNRDEAKLVGPVRSVVEKDSLYISEYRYEKDGRLVEVERQCISKMLCPDGPRTKTIKYEHDQSGKKVLGIEYDKDQSVVNREAYAYDDNGNLTATVHTTDSGRLWSGRFQWYDNRRNKIGDTSFVGITGNARSSGRSEYSFDEKGREIKGVFYDDQGKIRLEYVNKYDADGYLVELVGYLPGGKIDKKQSYVYDDRGAEIERSLYDSQGVLEAKFTSEYQYDKVGNWTKWVFRTWDNQQGKEALKSTQVTERTIAYYE